MERETKKAEKEAAKEAKAAEGEPPAWWGSETAAVVESSEFHTTPDGDTAEVSTTDGTILSLDDGEIDDLVGKSGPHSASAKSEKMFPGGKWGSEVQQAGKNDEMGEEEYEEETSVKVWVHEGVKYLRSSDNDLYDPDTQDHIGVWNEDTEEIEEVEDDE